MSGYVQTAHILQTPILIGMVWVSIYISFLAHLKAFSCAIPITLL